VAFRSPAVGVRAGAPSQAARLFRIGCRLSAWFTQLQYKHFISCILNCSSRTCFRVCSCAVLITPWNANGNCKWQMANGKWKKPQRLATECGAYFMKLRQGEQKVRLPPNRSDPNWSSLLSGLSHKHGHHSDPSDQFRAVVRLSLLTRFSLPSRDPHPHPRLHSHSHLLQPFHSLAYLSLSCPPPCISHAHTLPAFCAFRALPCSCSSTFSAACSTVDTG